MQKLLTFSQQKMLVYIRYKCLKFNETFTKEYVSFEQSALFI